MELVGPWPSGWEPQELGAGVVHDDRGQVDDAGSPGPVRDAGQTGDRGGPDPEVMSEHRAGEPRGVGVVVARGEVFESGTFFEVADGEFNGGVFTVELVGLDRVEVGAVRDERVVSPVGPQPSLCFVGETGAAHDQPDAAGVFTFAGRVDGFGDLGLPTNGVVDVSPGVIVDRCDCLFHVLVQANGDRPMDLVDVQTVDEFPCPEPGIGAHRDRSSGAGASHDSAAARLNKAKASINSLRAGNCGGGLRKQMYGFDYGIRCSSSECNQCNIVGAVRRKRMCRIGGI